jgi:hypothetical protein
MQHVCHIAFSVYYTEAPLSDDGFRSALCSQTLKEYWWNSLCRSDDVDFTLNTKKMGKNLVFLIECIVCLLCYKFDICCRVKSKAREISSGCLYIRTYECCRWYLPFWKKGRCENFAWYKSQQVFVRESPVRTKILSITWRTFIYLEINCEIYSGYIQLLCAAFLPNGHIWSMKIT